MMDAIAYLIGYTTVLNDYKQEIHTETRKEILGKIDGVKRAEFYRAGEAGLRPEYVLTTALIDYDGELEVELDGKRYGVYRTYKISEDYIELYCERKGGVK